MARRNISGNINPANIRHGRHRHIPSYRIWLYGFNFVLLSASLTFVAVTCRILHTDRMALFPLSHREPLILYIFAGPLLQALDILLGVAGVWRGRSALLTLYWWLLLAILLSDFLVGVLWIFRWRRLHAESGPYFLNALINSAENDDESTRGELFCDRWNRVQRELNCCGVYSPDDWSTKLIDYRLCGGGEESIPPESCGGNRSLLVINNSTKGGDLSSTTTTKSSISIINAENNNRKRRGGCRDALIKWLYYQSNIVFLLGVCAVIFLKVVGLVIMRTEIRKLGQEIYARKNMHHLVAQPKFSVDVSPFIHVNNNNRFHGGRNTNSRKRRKCPAWWWKRKREEEDEEQVVVNLQQQKQQQQQPVAAADVENGGDGVEMQEIIPN